MISIGDMKDEWSAGSHKSPGDDGAAWRATAKQRKARPPKSARPSRRERRASEPSLAEEAEFFEVLQRAERLSRSREPELDECRAAEVATLGELLGRLDALTALAMRRAGEEGVEEDLADVLASLYARAAGIAIAARDPGTADAWLGRAERLASSEVLRLEVIAGRADQARYRRLLQARVVMERGDERLARRLWTTLATGEERDELAQRAEAELAENQPRDVSLINPKMGRYRGFGFGFYGQRDRKEDDSYVTTHCLCGFFIPLLPLHAYRVIDRDGGYVVLRRAPLSRLARIARAAVLTALVLAVCALVIARYYDSSSRLESTRAEAMPAASEATMGQLSAGATVRRADTPRAPSGDALDEAGDALDAE